MRPVKCLGAAMRLAIAMLCLWLYSCASLAPWERGLLASPEMAWEPDPLVDGYRRHMHASNEGGADASALPGSGCGCE